MMKTIVLSLLLIGLSYGLIGKNIHSFQTKFKAPLFGQTAKTFDQQILDHFDSSEPQTYWSQRYWVMDSYYDPVHGPLFLYICGEGECQGLTKGSGFTSKLAQKYNGVAVSVEHRFYGKSQPFGHNNETYSTENLRYLSHNQALADLAVFIKYLKDNEVGGIHQDTPVITVGGSYPGALSAWFRYKYPHLTIGSYASSAVVNAIDNFSDYDKQVGISLGYYGAECPQSVKNVYAYIEEQLSTPENNHHIKAQFNALILDDDTFLEMVSNFPMGYVQYGNAHQFCNMMKGRSLSKQVAIFAFFLQGAAPYYTIESQQDTQYQEQANGRQWTYQCCTDYGWWMTPYPQDPIRPKPLNLEFFHKTCQQIYGDDYVTRADLTNNMMGGVDMRVDNIVFTNGLEDPWQWASIRQTEGQMDSYIADCKGCGHCGDLGTPKASDPESLKQQRQHVENHIDKWLAEYRQQLHGDNVNNIDFGHKQWEYDADEPEIIYPEIVL